MPHLNRDPVVAAASFVMAAQTIVSRDSNPNHPAVVAISRLSAGEADNATPSQATLSGNVRFLEGDGSAIFQAHLERIARGTGGDLRRFAVALDYVVGRPPTVNSPEAEAVAVLDRRR